MSLDKNSKLIIFLTFCILLFSCTTLKVTKREADTGYFPTFMKATIIHSKKTNLDQYNQLALVPEDDFSLGMLKEIGYFDTVVNFAGLEQLIIENNLLDKIGTVSNIPGINKAAKTYKNFLWVNWRVELRNNKQYLQLALVDASTMEDLFISETTSGTQLPIFNDQENYYPLMNSLLDYISENSPTYSISD